MGAVMENPRLQAVAVLLQSRGEVMQDWSPGMQLSDEQAKGFQLLTHAIDHVRKG